MVNFVPVSILEEQPTYNNKSYVNNLLFKNLIMVMVASIFINPASVL